MQRRNIALQRAVGFDGNKAAFGTQALSLRGDDFSVVVVDFRNHHRHVGGEAVRGVVGHNWAFQLGVPLLQCADFLLFHVHCAESKVHTAGNLLSVRHSVLDNDGAHLLRDGGAHHPAAAHRLLVGLARRVGRGGKGGHLKPWMVLQQGDKSLADHAGRADDGYMILFHLRYILSEFEDKTLYASEREKMLFPKRKPSAWG